MEHQAFLQIVQQSECKLFIEWYENASSKVDLAFLIFCSVQNNIIQFISTLSIHVTVCMFLLGEFNC